MTTDDREIVLADPPTVRNGTICNQQVPHSIREPYYYNAMQHHLASNSSCKPIFFWIPFYLQAVQIHLANVVKLLLLQT
jgi:hypothetical protein